jgi:cytochrome c553
VDSPKATIGIRGVVLLCIAVVIFSELLGLPILRRVITPAPRPNMSTPAAGAPSLVAWNEATIALSSTGNPVRGEFISRRCELCHGVEGFSSQASTPNLAGIDTQYLWKQLQDFRTGKRKSVIMQQIAGALTSRDAADAAAYYAMLPNAPDAQFSPSFPQTLQDRSAIETAQRLLAVGDPGRGIPPCQACHGPLGYVRPAPSLAWQNSDYVLSQLKEFAQGTRSNDVNLPMRTIAAELLPNERQAIAEFYGADLARFPVGYVTQ